MNHYVFNEFLILEKIITIMLKTSELNTRVPRKIIIASVCEEISDSQRETVDFCSLDCQPVWTQYRN